MPNVFDQFDQLQARVTTPPSAAPNVFDQFDDAPEAKPLTPEQQQERARLVEKLKQSTAAADEAGRVLEREESINAVARPILRGATDLADGALSLPKLAAAIPIGALNLAGANIRSPLTYSVKDFRSGATEALAPRNDTEKLTSGVTQALGGVLSGGTAGQLLARAGGAGSTLGNIGRVLGEKFGAQTVGGVAGAGTAEAARRSGAGPVGQTVAGVIGSLAPATAVQGTVRAANRVAQGLTRTPEAQRLLDAGVDLTPGQMNPKGFYNQLEENTQSLGMGIGPVVRSARDNARATFQRAAADRGSAPGKTVAQGSPAEMLDEAYESFRPLYDQAKGFPVSPKIVNTTGPDVPLDQAFIAAVGNRNSLATTAQRESVAKFLDQQLTRRATSSDDILEIRHSVREKSRQLRSQQRSDEAELLDDADTALSQVLESQLPAKPLQALKTADAKYGDYKTLENAVDRGSTKPDGFTAYDLAQAAKQANRGDLKGSYARGGGGPLRELSDDALKSMEVRSPANGQRILGLVGSYPLFPGVLAASGSQTGRRIAQGVTATQVAGRRLLQPVQPLISDPYHEQLSLALQQAIELQKRKQAEGRR